MDPVVAAPDRLIAGDGTPESAWRLSPFIATMPLVGLDHLLGNARRVVVVAPHPDDEVLGCGGLMAACAARAMEVLVLAVTDGEHCYPGDTHWTPARLRVRRRAELRAALGELGLRPDCLLHLQVADGHVAQSGQLAHDLTRLLRRGDLVLCTWSRDGHPDHEATAAAVARACAAAGARRLQYPVWGWHWMAADRKPDPRLGAQRLHLEATHRSAKRRAIGCFATQTGRCEPPLAGEPVLPPHVLARFQRPFEVFFR